MVFYKPSVLGTDFPEDASLMEAFYRKPSTACLMSSDIIYLNDFSIL